MLKGFQYLLWAMVVQCWLVFTGHGVLASGPDTVLLLSSDNAYYQETVRSLKDETDIPGRFTTIFLNKQGQTDSPLLQSASHIIAFGIRASTLVFERDLASKSILCFLTHEQFRDLEAGQVHSAALLDQPLSRYLAFSSALISNARTGIILLEDTDRGAEQVPDQRFRLQTRMLEAPNRLLSSLRDMLDSIDVFLMTPNLSLYNRNSLRGILLTAYRAGKPVISYSPAHVRSGALGSIYSSPQNIGRHLLDLLADKTAHKDPPGNKVEYARYYTIATNEKVAASLEIELADNDSIRQRMQEFLR